MTPLAQLALILAALPAVLFAVNLLALRRAPRPRATSKAPAEPEISVLIPARNEAAVIGDALAAVLSDSRVGLEVVVLDDHSTDDTAAIVRAFAARDARVRLVSGAPLPDGWCGKQHACWQLAGHARHELLLFLDADVRLEPHALGRLAEGLTRRPSVALVSGVPRQCTGTLLERLLIPLIHFILLGFLPLPAARRWNHRAFAAGCGQLFLARRSAYFAAGGHRAIRASLHDGLKLPRFFRSAGFVTDILDATDLASCRMYRSAAEVWRGLGRNATEGLAHPPAIVPWTILLLGGHVLPWGLLALAWITGQPAPPAAVFAVGLGWLPRLLATWRFRQPLIGAILHPLGIALLVLLQWQALLRRWLGRPSEWRGRKYPDPRGGSSTGPDIAPDASRGPGATSTATPRTVSLPGHPFDPSGPGPARPAEPAAARNSHGLRVAFGAALITGVLALTLAALRANPATVGPDSAATNQVESFQLPDQFGTNHAVRFPRERPLLLLFSDRRGYEEVHPWIELLKRRWGTTTDIAGIADISAAPRFLRRRITEAIRQADRYPLLLDFEGRVTGPLRGVARTVNLLVISREGRILARLTGPPDDARLRHIGDALGAEPR